MLTDKFGDGGNGPPLNARISVGKLAGKEGILLTF